MGTMTVDDIKAVKKYQENIIAERIDQIQNDKDILKLIEECGERIEAKKYFKDNEEKIVRAAMEDLAQNQFVKIINGSAKLVKNQRLAIEIERIWLKAQKNTNLFIQELEEAFFKGKSGEKTALFTKSRTIKGQSNEMTLGDFIVKIIDESTPTNKVNEEIKGWRKSYSYYKDYIGKITTSIDTIRSTLQGSVSNIKGALGEQQALSYVTAVLEKIYGKKGNIKGMITGALHGNLIDRVGTVQIKPDVLIAYQSAPQANTSLLAISAKQYSKTSMGIAHQTVRSLLAMFTWNNEQEGQTQNFYDYYLNLYSQRKTDDTVTIQIPSYTYLMITMNALIGHMKFFSNTTTSQLKQIDMELQSNNTTSIPIPLVNAFFGFTSDAMYVVSTKELLHEFYKAIKGGESDTINTYKRILSIKSKTEIDAALSLTTKGREKKYKNLSVSISLNAGMASRNNKFSNIIKKFALSEKS